LQIIYQAINATYGSNLKAVDLGNYRILFPKSLNLKLFNKKAKPRRKASGFCFLIPDQHGFVFLKSFNFFPVFYKKLLILYFKNYLCALIKVSNRSFRLVYFINPNSYLINT
jgi:hypothetical protein